MLMDAVILFILLGNQALGRGMAEINKHEGVRGVKEGLWKEDEHDGGQ